MKLNSAARLGSLLVIGRLPEVDVFATREGRTSRNVESLARCRDHGHGSIISFSKEGVYSANTTYGRALMSLLYICSPAEGWRLRRFGLRRSNKIAGPGPQKGVKKRLFTLGDRT